MNFFFLHPGFLWALPAALSPLIIHWLTRPRPKPLPFSSLELIRLAVQSQRTYSRLQQILLMAARCLLLAALALLFARPTVFFSSAARGSGDEVSVVFMVDTSYSMDARSAGVSALDRAKAQASDILGKLGPRDRAGLVVFSDRVEMSLPLSQNPAKLREALSSLTATDRPTRVAPALSVAYQMLAEEPGGQKAVVVLSDLAANGWKEQSNVAGFDPRVHLVLCEAAPAQGNAAVSGVRWTDDDGGVFDIRSWGKPAEPERIWRILSGGKVIAQGQARLSVEAVRPSFRLQTRAAEWGTVSLDPDGLALDDRYFFAAPPAARFSVLAVNGSPGASPVQDEAFYLAPVLDGLARQGSRVKTVLQSEWGQEDLSAVDVVVLLNSRPLDAAAAAKLRDHLGRGRGLWVTAGDNVELAGPLGDLVPARFLGVSAKKQAVRPGRDASAAALGRILSEGDGFEWDQVEMGRRLDVDPAPGSQVILEGVVDGRPVLLTGRAHGGPVALLTVTADRDWANLPTKPLFPVLARELIFFLAGRSQSSPGTSLLVDEPVRWAAQDPFLSVLTVRRPDGASEEAPVRGGRLLYENTDRAGVYEILANGGGLPLARFLVNADVSSGEGDLARAAKSGVASWLPARDLLWIPFGEPAAQKFAERVRGKDLTSGLGLAALLLFGLEMLLSQWGRRRTEPSRERVYA